MSSTPPRTPSSRNHHHRSNPSFLTSPFAPAEPMVGNHSEDFYTLVQHHVLSALHSCTRTCSFFASSSGRTTLSIITAASTPHPFLPTLREAHPPQDLENQSTEAQEKNSIHEAGKWTLHQPTALSSVVAHHAKSLLSSLVFDYEASTPQSRHLREMRMTHTFFCLPHNAFIPPSFLFLLLPLPILSVTNPSNPI